MRRRRPASTASSDAITTEYIGSSISGGVGNDVLQGDDAGNDTISGGGSSDVLLFNPDVHLD